MVESEEERFRTIFCGNLHDDVSEDILYELFLQVCMIVKIIFHRITTCFNDL